MKPSSACAVLSRDLHWLPAGSELPQETECKFVSSQESLLPQPAAPVHEEVLLLKLGPGQASAAKNLHSLARCEARLGLACDVLGRRAAGVGKATIISCFACRVLLRLTGHPFLRGRLLSWRHTQCEGLAENTRSGHLLPRPGAWPRLDVLTYVLQSCCMQLTAWGENASLA